jgi:uncharacterized protein YjbI with pentapeptide repeats
MDSMLQQSSFANSRLHETNFRNSYLDETNLLIVDFTNADLADARGLTDKQLYTLNIYDEPIILTNARFTNGTFAPIDSSNLVTEQEVRNLTQVLCSISKVIISVYRIPVTQ